MADSRITELPIASALSGSELFYGLDGTSDIKISPRQFAEYIVEGYSFDTTNSDTDTITGAINYLNQIGTNINDLLLAVHPVGSLYWSRNSTSPASLFGGTWTQVKDKFILAAGDTYAVGATGGEATHSLSVAEMPSHNHGGVTGGPSTDKTGGPSTANTGNNSQAHQHSIPSLTGSTTSSGSHTHTVTYNGFSRPNGEGTCVSSIPKGNPNRYMNSTTNGAHTHTFTTTASTSGQDSAKHKHTMAHTHTLQNHTHSIAAQGGSAHNNMPPYIAKYCWERTA